MDIALILLMIGVGIFAATYGSLVGSAGGFVVVPMLLFLSPESSPALLTAISLTGILMAGLSGAWAYHRLGLIDYRSALAFAIPGILGAVLGVRIVQQINPLVFRIIFGITLAILGAFLLRHRNPTTQMARRPGLSYRNFQDRQGTIYEYQFNLPVGLTANFGIGVLKSLLGIGGGLILTPFAITILGFPTLVAVATSLFTVVFTTIAALLSHIAMGTFTEDSFRLLPVALGMVVGGQIGPRIARHVGGIFIKRLLAGTLAVIGISMAASQFV